MQCLKFIRFIRLFISEPFSYTVIMVSNNQTPAVRKDSGDFSSPQKLPRKRRAARSRTLRDGCGVKPAGGANLLTINTKNYETDSQLAAADAMGVARRMSVRADDDVRRERQHHERVHRNPRKGGGVAGRLRLPPLQTHQAVGARGQNQNLLKLTNNKTLWKQTTKT